MAKGVAAVEELNEVLELTRGSVVADVGPKAETPVEDNTRAETPTSKFLDSISNECKGRSRPGKDRTELKEPLKAILVKIKERVVGLPLDSVLGPTLFVLASLEEAPYHLA